MTAYKKIPSSRSGSTVVMDDRSINLLIELSSIGGLPHLYIVSYFKSGIKDLSWKKKAHSCSFCLVSSSIVFLDEMHPHDILSLSIHPCLLNHGSKRAQSKGIYIVLSTTSFRETFLSYLRRSKIPKGPKCLRSIPATNRKFFKQTSFSFTSVN